MLLISPNRHPLAKLAKDVAAGAVLVSAINALCVGYLLFYDKLLDIFDSKNDLHIMAAKKENVAVLILESPCGASVDVVFRLTSWSRVASEGMGFMGTSADSVSWGSGVS